MTHVYIVESGEQHEGGKVVGVFSTIGAAYAAACQERNRYDHTARWRVVTTDENILIRREYSGDYVCICKYAVHH
jgi:hypothetical protein